MSAAEKPDPKSKKKPSSVRFYSEWIPRESDSIPATLEVLRVDGKTMKVDLLSKKKKRRNRKSKI